MHWQRLLTHLVTPSVVARRHFPSSLLTRIETAIEAGETRHTGELCFVVEAALDLDLLLAGVSGRERALQVFGQLGVWDTAANNGVLIYLLLADHDIEIVADRGINACVDTADWKTICEQIEVELRQGHFETGVIAAIDAVNTLLTTHFPAVDGDLNDNELPNTPVVL